MAASSRERGLKMAMATATMATTGRLARNTEPHQKCFRRTPETTGPMAPPAPAKPTQTAIARVRSSGGKIADDQRKRRRHQQRGTDALTARPTMTCPVELARPLTSEPAPNSHEADEEGALATEAVAEGAGRQEEAGEHERVGVDDPLQGRRAGTEVFLEGRQRRVEPRHAMTTMTRERHRTARRNQRRSCTSGRS